MTNQINAFNSVQAAIYIGIQPSTMKYSRMTGLIGHVKAPTFKKIGRKVVYLQSDLDQWLADLPNYSNTSEVSS